MSDLDEGAPRCPRCGVHDLEPAGERKKPYWWCPDCGAVRIEQAGREAQDRIGGASA